MKFLKIEQIGLYKFKDDEFGQPLWESKYEFFHKEWFIGFSKRVGDNLPLMTTSTSERPCVDRTDIDNPVLPYPLEVDRFQDGCKEDQVSGKQYDERFINTGGKVSELDV